MKQYIQPKIEVVELDIESVVMVQSPIGWGDGETNTMEAPMVRQRSSDWSDYEG